MPAPTYTITQVLAICDDNGGASADETNLDQGNVEIHADCCRTYGTTVRLSGFTFVLGGSDKTLSYEGTVATCSKTGTGTKVFSGPAFRLCGSSAATYWDIVFPDDPSPFFSLPWVDGNLGIDMTGPCPGSAVDFVDITSESNLNAAAAGLQSAIIAATCQNSGDVTCMASWNGGSDRRIRVTFNTAAKVPSALTSSPATLINNSDASESSDVTIVGPTSGTAVMVYWSLEWSNCSTGGVVAQLLLESDDSLIAEYGNDHYCIKNGRKGILHRRHVACAHPCIAAGETQKRAFSHHPETICFTPSLALPICLGGYRDSLYTLTLGSAPVGFGEFLSGFVDTYVNGGAKATVFPATLTSMTISGPFTMVGNLHTDGTGLLFSDPLAGIQNFTGVSIDFEIDSALYVEARITGRPCGAPIVQITNGTIVHAGVITGTNQAEISGGTPAFPVATPIGIGINLNCAFAADLMGSSPTYDYCGGANSLTHSPGVAVNPISGTVGPGVFWWRSGGVDYTFTTSDQIAPSGSMDQSGTAYP